jgi:predicted PurR-regulated permease PerM
MAGAMHGVFAGARLDAAAIGSVDAQRLATSLGSLGEDISEYLTGLSGRAMDSDSLARLRMLGARHQALMELLHASRDLALAAVALPEGTPARALAGQLIEAADAMLHTLHDAMAGSDSLEAELLLAILLAFFFYRDGPAMARRATALMARLGGATGVRMLRLRPTK